MLPLDVIYGLEDPNEQLQVLNELSSNSIDSHAPLKRCKITRPPAPWIKDLEIKNLQRQRDTLRKTAHETQQKGDWESFRKIGNELKTLIKNTKRSFYRKALSSNRP